MPDDNTIDIPEIIVNTPRFTIWYTGDITDKDTTRLIDHVLVLRKANAVRNITIFLNSLGGEMDACLAIADIMPHIPRVRWVVVGKAYSAAAIMILSQKKGTRYILPNSKLMIHAPSYEVDGRQRDNEAYHQICKRDTEAMNKLILNHTLISAQELEKGMNGDWYFTAKEALNKGLVDGILTRGILKLV